MLQLFEELTLHHDWHEIFTLLQDDFKIELNENLATYQTLGRVQTQIARGYMKYCSIIKPRTSGVNIWEGKNDPPSHSYKYINF